MGEVGLTALWLLSGAVVGGSIGFFWRAARDRTRTVEEELSAVRQRAADEHAAVVSELTAARARESLALSFARELRVPLRGVLGVADSIVNGNLALPPRAKLGLHAIVASGQHLDRMLSDVTECERLDDLSVDLTPVDLHAAVSEVMVMMASLAGEKSVEIVNDVPMNFPIARGDETRLAQVLAHLIGHAIACTVAGEVRIIGERVKGMLRVSVTDTGPGYGPEALERAFDEEGGIGGLAFAKKLLELQRGELSIVSEVGHGSALAFTLPEAGPGAQRRGHVNLRTLSSSSFKSSIPAVNGALARMMKHAPSAYVRVQDRTDELPSKPVESGRYSLRQVPPTALLAELERTPPSSHAKSPSASAPPSVRPSLWPSTAVPLVLQVSDDEAELGRFAEELAPLGCRFVAVRSATEALDRFSLEGPFTAVLVHARWSDSERAAFVRTLRERVAGGQKLPLLVVLDEATAQRPEELFAAGASEVVQEPFAMLELLERLRSQFAVARLALAAERLVSREFVELLGCGSFAELKLGACVERDMSVLFADLQGFTKASERMTSRQVFGWLNKRFGAVVPALRANGGFVDKFIGDAVMALFAQSPKGALRAAIEASHAMRSVDGINRLGIGVHHGPTMIGTLGEKDRFAPTVVSDTVNVAARLESLTRRFGSSALVSEETLNQLDGVERPSTRYLGAFRVKGRDKALRIHELLDAEEAAYAAQKRAAAQILQRVVAFVDRGDLGNAARAAALGASEFPSDSALAFYIIELERVARHEADFDGVIALQEK